MRMYHGPRLEPSGRGQRPQPALGLGADLEVVVDDGHLPVEQEVRGSVASAPARRAGRRPGRPARAGSLERLVPLAVPVGVRNDGDPAGGHDRQTMTRGRLR